MGGWSSHFLVYVVSASGSAREVSASRALRGKLGDAALSQDECVGVHTHAHTRVHTWRCTSAFLENQVLALGAM